MVKFTAKGSDGPLIGFGLSRRNIELLKQGKPIKINLADMGLPSGTIMIFYGKTEAAMAKEMLPFLDENTRVYGTETLEG